MMSVFVSEQNPAGVLQQLTHVLFSELHDASSKRWTQLSSFRALVFLLLTQTCAGQIQVVGPSQPVVATVGDDVVLSCRLEPAVDASDMSVEWYRQDLDPRYVYVSSDGEETEDYEHPDYKERTSLSDSKRKLGDVSLKLSRVKLSDQGKYTCFLPSVGRDATVELVVGIDPFTVISLAGLGGSSSSVVLQCESAGWYPEPELLWLDGEGKLLSAGPTETVRGPDDLYTVSSRVTVEKRHSNKFTCRVQQNNISQTREALIQVTDEFFKVQSSYASTIVGLAAGLAVFISAAIVLLILAVVLFVHTRRQIGTKRRGYMQVSTESDDTGKENQQESERLTEEKLKPVQQRRKEAENTIPNLKEELDGKKKEVGNKETELQLLQKEKKNIQKDLKTLKKDLQAKNTELEKVQKELTEYHWYHLFSKERQRKEKEEETIQKEAENLFKQLMIKMREFQTKVKECEEKQTELLQLLEEKHNMETELQILEQEMETNKWTDQRIKWKAEEEKWLKTKKHFLNEKLKWMETERKLKTVIQNMNEELDGMNINTNADPTRSDVKNQMEEDEKQKWMKTFGNLKTELKNMNQKLELSGPITLGQGHDDYMRFKNISPEEIKMGGWNLGVQTNTGDPDMYPFDESTRIQAGGILALRHADTDNVKLKWSDLLGWWPEDLQISLISKDGEKLKML